MVFELTGKSDCNRQNGGVQATVVERLRGLPTHLAEKIKGQEQVVGRVCSVLTRGELGFAPSASSARFVPSRRPLVLDLFLQILEDARITLATGRTLDLRGFYVTCTSNSGSAESMRMESAPFASVERTVLMRVRERLRPELVGRINEIIVFARLDYATQREICEAMIAAEIARLRSMGYEIEITPAVVEFLVREGYHRSLGARPMRRAVERFLQDAVVESLLSDGSASGCINVHAEEGKLSIIRRSYGCAISGEG